MGMLFFELGIQMIASQNHLPQFTSATNIFEKTRYYLFKTQRPRPLVCDSAVFILKCHELMMNELFELYVVQ